MPVVRSHTSCHINDSFADLSTGGGGPCDRATNEGLERSQDVSQARPCRLQPDLSSLGRPPQPLLFEELTLRTGQDVSDLVAFIGADYLEPTLSGYVYRLIVVDDPASAEVPCSRQLMRLRKRLSSFVIEA